MLFKANRLLLEAMSLQCLATKTNRIEAEKILRLRDYRARNSLHLKPEAHFQSTLSTAQADVSSTALNLQIFESLFRGVSMESATEHCENPWNGKCKSSDIQLYIHYKNRQLSICRRCWSQIADKDLEW